MPNWNGSGMVDMFRLKFWGNHWHFMLMNFTLKDAASYRAKGASNATPGFDVMDYGQETYEFGSSTQDARHFDKYVLKVLQENAETLSELFNSEEK